MLTHWQEGVQQLPEWLWLFTELQMLQLLPQFCSVGSIQADLIGSGTPGSAEL